MTGPVVAAAKAAGGGGGRRPWRQAVVVAVNADGTVDLQLGGGDTVIGSAACLDTVGVVAGDSVWCLQSGADILVLGRQGGGAERTYTPALTATTTNPTLGTGAVQTGRWAMVGKCAVVRGSIRFGTAGVNAGSGTYLIGLPVPVVSGLGTAFAPLGWVVVRDESAGSILEGFASIQTDNSASVNIRYAAAGGFGTSTLVTASTPMTFAASDRIDFRLMYPTA